MGRLPKRSESEPTTPVLGSGDLSGQNSDPWLYSVAVYPEIEDLKDSHLNNDPRIVRPISIIDEFITSHDVAREVVAQATLNLSEGAVFADELQPQVGSQVTEIWTINDRFNLISAIYLAVKAELDQRRVSFTSKRMMLFPEEKPSIEVIGSRVIKPGKDLWVSGITLDRKKPGSPGKSILTRGLRPYVPHEV